MKDRIFFTLQLFLTFLLMCISVSSCHEDNDPPTVPFTGEWFGTYTDADQTAIEIVEFTGNGLFKKRTIYVSKSANFDQQEEGKYTYDGRIKITYSTKYNPRHIYEVWRIVKAGKYSFSIIDEANNEQQNYVRIVDTYSMNVGECKMFCLSDTSFTSVVYQSCDDKVVSVSDNGEILAKKRGETFVRAISTSGEAVIRVRVNDPDNVIDDYTRYINASVNKIIYDYGNNYLEYSRTNGTTWLEYNIIDNIVKKLYFHYLIRDRVYRIEGDFRSDVDLSTIVASLDNKYECVMQSENMNGYIYNQEGSQISIVINLNMRTFVYEFLPNDYEMFDGIIAVNINNVASWFGLELSNSVQDKSYKLYSCTLNSSLFDLLQISYKEETGRIRTLQLVCKEPLEISDIEGWYKEHYIATDHPSYGRIYSTNTSFMRSEYYILIQRNASLGRTVVSYVHI